MNKDNLLVSAVFWCLTLITWISFELFAPYCAKNVCCAEAPGAWGTVPLINFVFLIFAILYLIFGVCDDEK